MPLSVSTLADQVGAASFALKPIFRLIKAYVIAAEHVHGDETTMPVIRPIGLAIYSHGIGNLQR